MFTVEKILILNLFFHIYFGGRQMIFSLENCKLKWHTSVEMAGLWGYDKKINADFQDFLDFKNLLQIVVVSFGHHRDAKMGCEELAFYKILLWYKTPQFIGTRDSLKVAHLRSGLLKCPFDTRKLMMDGQPTKLLGMLNSTQSRTTPCGQNKSP